MSAFIWKFPDNTCCLYVRLMGRGKQSLLLASTLFQFTSISASCGWEMGQTHLLFCAKQILLLWTLIRTSTEKLMYVKLAVWQSALLTKGNFAPLSYPLLANHTERLKTAFVLLHAYFPRNEKKTTPNFKPIKCLASEGYSSLGARPKSQ